MNVALTRTLSTIWSYRVVVGRLSIRSLKNRYSATAGGIAWAIALPLMNLFVFWFVFSYGLRLSAANTDVPYFLVLFCGLIPWMAFADALNNATNSVFEHQYLVKKIAFPIEILPVAPIISAAIVHACMLVFLVMLLMFYGVWPTFYTLYLFLAFPAMMVFALCLGWVLAALNVFQRDVGQLVGVIISLWFWMTPIVWELSMLSPNLRTLMQLNPMVFVVETYRGALIYGQPPWEWSAAAMAFGVSVGLLALLGPGIFLRLKSHFADVM
ncbi:MAG: ABC transporter permease [Hyphomicrobium sp.]|uniref:ABC transporter permease n=1 Tax=Hyphomicrobium sp. TaxID=82 RepID=UPI0025B92EEB|nr:ABC transporter permease [Hyphomicrobium sp.]MBZ0211759.1 ABC transporter permease [Hyphomicrobium sp.]